MRGSNLALYHVISLLYHVSVSCPYIIKNARWDWHDMTWSPKKDEIELYHVLARDMIYHDLVDDIQWYIMREAWYMMIYHEFLYRKLPFLVSKTTPIPGILESSRCASWLIPTGDRGQMCATRHLCTSADCVLNSAGTSAALGEISKRNGAHDVGLSDES